MKTDIIVKVLIVKAITLLPLTAYAWVVSDHIVELPREHELVDRGHVSKSSDGSTFEKIQIKLTEDEQASTDYRRVEQHLKFGESSQAQTLLTSILHGSPNHHVSRAELATLYLKQDQLELAEETLFEGLKIDENNSDFLRLMAVVHDRREEPDKALALLVKVKDSRKQDKNYIAFLAHLYQETGHYSLARQHYFHLLQMEPKNPLWLLGVSIALDSEGQRAAALEGYHQLGKEGNIDPSVLQYVQDRIRALKG